MSVFKRQTTAGETPEFHYRFMKSGKSYSGVCAGCCDKESAEQFEQHIKETVTELAKQKSVKALVENFRDELAGGEKIKLSEAFKRFLAKPRKNELSEKQRNSKKSRFDDFVKFMQKKHPEVRFVNDVTYRHAEEYIAVLRESGRFNKTVVFKSPKGKSARYKTQSKELSSATLNRYLEEIQAVFAAIQKDSGMQENPFDGIQPVSETAETREAFSEKELEDIIYKADPFIRSIFIVGFFTALREGDISTLRWSDVLWDQGIIRRKLLKTGAIVEIPIMPPLANFLREQTGRDPEYVLPEHAAMYQDNPSGISYRVKKFLEEEVKIKTTKKVPGRSRAVSIKDVHSLRHTFCYFAGVAGIPLVVVQSIVGHMTPEMTAHYTAHADRKTKREKLAALPCFNALVRETRRKVLTEQTRRAVIAAIKTADEETLNRIASLLLPVKPKRSLLRNTEQGKLN